MPSRSLEEPQDRQFRDLIQHPSVSAVLCRRDAGKSAAAYRILEIPRTRAAPYALGPASLKKLLPDWIGVAQDLGLIPANSAVLVDEADTLLPRRNSMPDVGRGIGSMVNLSR